MTRPAVKCPGCKKHLSEEISWPFCSVRCKSLDLGDWANEKFKIASRGIQEDENSEIREEDLENSGACRKMKL